MQDPAAPSVPKSPAGIVRLNLGHQLDDTAISPSIHDRLTADKAYFPDFMTYLAAKLGFAHIADAAHQGIATRYGPGDTVALGCRQSPARWVWRPEPTISLLTRNGQPTSSQLERLAYPSPVSDGPLLVGALELLFHNFGQALGTNYYERTRLKIEAVYGENSNDWPPVWQFGRAVRNAMSHGGAIDIRKVNAPPVRWKSLSYSWSENGRKILHTDLWPGDLFDLIQDLDALVPKSEF